VGGNPQVLSKYENLLGLESTLTCENPNLYTNFHEGTSCFQSSSTWKTELNRINLIKKSVWFDGVVHLNNGRFITPYFGDRLHPKELVYSKWMRKLIRFYARSLLGIEYSLSRLKNRSKAIFLTFQGSDARETKCFVEKHQQSGLAEEVIGRSGKTNNSIRRKKMLLAGIADKIYSLNPDLLEVLPKGSEFLPYATEAGLNPKILPFNQSNEFVVGHAPTHRIVKGTNEIIRVIENLRSKGINIRLELIEGLSREDAQKKYQEIDLFIDQLVIGWYGVVSLEVMALGKPVLCFIKGRGLRFVPQKMLADLPIINADESSLEEKLVGVMQMSIEQRQSLAERGLAYLKEWHDPTKIAQRVVGDYRKVLSFQDHGII
jgi:glycosyltransferase involved in cell wall biosynthesis